jgi:hypothetical protein
VTQTYRNPGAIEWMRKGLCPECGNRPEDHSTAAEFWLRDPGKCDLLPRGVTDRINHQRALDYVEAQSPS